MPYLGKIQGPQSIITKDAIESQRGEDLAQHQQMIITLKNKIKALKEEIPLLEAELVSMKESAALAIQKEQNLFSAQVKEFNLEKEAIIADLASQQAEINQFQIDVNVRFEDAKKLEEQFTQKLEELNTVRAQVNGLKDVYQSEILKLKGDRAALDQQQAQLRDREKEAQDERLILDGLYNEIRELQAEVKKKAESAQVKTDEANELYARAADRMEQAQKMHTSLLITQEERDKFEAAQKKLDEELANVKPLIDSLNDQKTQLLVQQRTLEIREREASNRLRDAKELEKKLVNLS